MDRKSVVNRNHPVLTQLEPRSPLSVGNGEFAFSADFTGLQTFPDAYEIPLGTQSNWGWHYTGGHQVFGEQDIVYQAFETYGRKVLYPMKPEDKEEAYHWLRQNPHRLQLGRISFRLLREDGQEAGAAGTVPVRQELNLWTGVLHSEFTVQGAQVRVETACDPQQDCIAIRVHSRLIREGRLQLFVVFPSPDMTHRSWSKSVFPDWEQDSRHCTELTEVSMASASLRRVLDEDKYAVKWLWDAGRLEQTGPHEFTLLPEAVEDSESWSCSVAFAAREPEPQPAEAVLRASSVHWEEFWNSGAAIDLAGSADPRAAELERRVVLSQFLCAVHSGGSMPPQETGYMYNSWFGKIHLEMHWWHAAHFPLWDRADLLRRSMDWYLTILPEARELARSQGYAGARWPKMVGYNGRQTPSPVAPGLIWQQPHPMALAEMCYSARPERSVLEHYRDIVFEAADFMVSYAHWDGEREAYVLGPPLIPAQENHAMNDSLNPPYELEYWKFGLEIAVRWAERLDQPVNPAWVKVASQMARPRQENGVYLAHENCLGTFTDKNHDHPSMLGALGLLPGSLIDQEIMRNTLLKVKECWDWESAWGWDFPMCAMTAARLGEPELAVDFLLMDATKNTYLPNGHNYQRPGLWAYLPGNGGLLTAVAMMAAGWAGGEERQNPGFPQDGSWSVEWEGLKPLL
ncbi:glycoside hydrolase family 65 [Paenibacillus donghaensis]|uniref:Glycoside hydrolase family 65 n=1 Tax=Paenibacillus donghaensis TaxID=414771 RepID=A0A2Z2KEK7_9BACL|nr:glycoside hydrolase family 65 [Paenibacillus donghaensis]ASA21570.1 glycoside hydrolase family 65 [Paenibacillus donghaensis]